MTNTSSMPSPPVPWASPTLPSFSPLTRLEMIWAGSWQQGCTAAAKSSKRFILRFMQNSLCGDWGGLRFNIHADLEEMLIMGLGNLHFCLILLLPGSVGQPPGRAPLLSCCPSSRSPRRQLGLGSEAGWELACLSSAEPALQPLGAGRASWLGSTGEELQELLGHLDRK